MQILTKTLTVKTQKREILQDISHEVKSFVTQTGIKNGQVLLFVPHTTAAVTINENADPDVQRDMVLGIRDAFPDQQAFNHMEGNSDAHIKSSVIGVDQHIMVKNGQMVLGTWQGIYFCEFDGPRTRKLHIQVMGN